MSEGIAGVASERRSLRASDRSLSAVTSSSNEGSELPISLNAARNSPLQTLGAFEARPLASSGHSTALIARA